MSQGPPTRFFPSKAAGADAEDLNMEESEPAPVLASDPREGDSMIVLREPHCSNVVDRLKDLELRSHRIRRHHYLANSSTRQVVAFLTFGESFELDDHGYAAHRERHRCASANRPYKKTFATVISSVRTLRQPVPYRLARGAIGYLRFRPLHPRLQR